MPDASDASQETTQYNGMLTEVPFTESHPSPGQASRVPHQGSLEQEDRLRPRRRQGGLRSCPIRAPCHRTSAQLQGQARQEARQEEGTIYPTHQPCLHGISKAQKHDTNASQLGTFGRAKRKVDEMTKVIAESRRAGH